jgi:heme exporter protein B
MLSVFLQVIRRDLLLAMRQKSDVLNTLFFFVVVVTMVPLGIGPEPALLRDIAAGVVWVAALLAAILSLPRLFANDYADGTLEQMLLSAEPLSLIVLGKAAAHWLTTGLPLTVMAIAFGVVFDLDMTATLVLVVSLALGTPVLSLIGSIGAALTLGLRGGGVLTSLLVLPLYIPVLIFGAGAVGAAASGLDVTAYFLLLGAFALFAVVLTPWAVAIALRISVE